MNHGWKFVLSIWTENRSRRLHSEIYPFCLIPTRFLNDFFLNLFKITRLEIGQNAKVVFFRESWTSQFTFLFRITDGKKILYSSVNKKVLFRTRPEALPERYRHTRTVLPDSVRVTASVVNGFVRSKRHCETFTRFLNYRTNSLIAELL